MKNKGNKVISKTMKEWAEEVFAELKIVVMECLDYLEV